MLCRRIVVMGSALGLALALAGCEDRRARRPTRTASPTPTVVDDDPRPPPAPSPTVAEPAPRPRPTPPPPPPRPVRSSRCPGRAEPGERFEVAGVDAGDTLNVRGSPDPRSEVLGELPPDTTGVLGLGPRERTGTARWRKVRCGDLVGWVNERFLAPELVPRAGRR